MMIALAGRRVDALDASQPRFPLQNVDRVGLAARQLLRQHGVTALVSSAACGADLIGLVAAGKLGLRRLVVLPFGRDKFRETSVVDRPGSWGEMYDEVLDDVEARGNLVILETGKDDEPYSMTNRAILDEASSLAKHSGDSVAAMLLWEGVSRGKDDYTDQFGAEARRRGLAVFEISTI